MKTQTKFYWFPRSIRLELCLLAGLALSACSTTDSRIDKNRDAFSSYPPQIQEAIRAKRVEVGFDENMVLLALGAPDRRYERVEEGKPRVSVWAYFDHGPHFSFGIGAFGGGGGTAVGGGIVASDRNRYAGEKIRVLFQEGRVTGVETAR